jgi:hypothetical protein
MSLLVGGLAVLLLTVAAVNAEGALRVGLLLVTSMLSLALVEHVLMITPLSAMALWRWAVRSPAPTVAS